MARVHRFADQVLTPFEDNGLLTARGQRLLSWAREQDSDDDQ